MTAVTQEDRARLGGSIRMFGQIFGDDLSSRAYLTGLGQFLAALDGINSAGFRVVKLRHFKNEYGADAHTIEEEL